MILATALLRQRYDILETVETGKPCKPIEAMARSDGGVLGSNITTADILEALVLSSSLCK